MERLTINGESPVGEKKKTPESTPSTTGHVESCWNPGGPPSKAKHSLLTDSGQVPRGKGEKNPNEGSEIEHETVYLQAVRGLFNRPEYVPFA
jgi:hypothetical protein